MEVSSAAPFRELTVAAFVERLASAEPVPGGGSASAVAAAIAAGLVAMVASLSIGRPRYVDHEAVLIATKDEATGLADRCLALADDDADAYAGYAAAMKLPRERPEEQEVRRVALQAAARAASLVPLSALEACRDIVAAAERLAGRSNVNAASDLAVASLLAEAAARGAGANVLVNLPATGDEGFAAELGERVDILLAETGRLAEETRAAVAAGVPRPPLPA